MVHIRRVHVSRLPRMNRVSTREHTSAASRSTSDQIYHDATKALPLYRLISRRAGRSTLVVQTTIAIMSTRPHNKALPPTPSRPSIKRSLTSMMSSFSRKPSRGRTVQRRSSWDVGWEAKSQSSPSRPRAPPQPHPWKSRTHKIEVVESGGLALADAQNAFTDSRRAVWTRIVWSLPSEHDVGAHEVLARIDRGDVSESLAQLGVGRTAGLGADC